MTETHEPDANESSDELMNGIAATLSSMNSEERARFAKLWGTTVEHLNMVIENWKASRQ
jgi:hypothetical protein